MCAYKKPPPKGASSLDKKPPVNPKYAHVQSRLDTGPTVDKIKFITNKEYTRRRDEIHFRLSKAQLHELYCEYEQEELEDIFDADSKMGSSPKIVCHTESSTPHYSKPYLIYDVRDPSEYNEGHLLQARNYPFTMMRQDKIHPELYNFRNKEGQLIILYCNDEIMSLEAAKLLVQRGTDNIYLLTGGLYEFAMDYNSFLEGRVNLPPGLQPTTSRSGLTSSRLGIADGKSSSSITSSRHTPSIRGSIPPSTHGSQLTAARLNSLPPATTRLGGLMRRDDRSESGMSTRSVADTIISKATARKGKF
eukprot:gene2053-4008_t